MQTWHIIQVYTIISTQTRSTNHFQLITKIHKKKIRNKKAPINLPTVKCINEYHSKNTKTKNYNSLIKHILPKNLLLSNKNYYYIFDNVIQIIKNKNIKPNTRPINRLLCNHLPTHKKKSKLYFIPNTIKLKPEYTSIKTKYEPFLNSNHPNHQATQQTYGCLYKSIQNHPNIHRRRLFYALVTTFDKSLILLRSRDIGANPGPMPNILETHPSPHKQRYETYFITCTIKLQPKYQHLAKAF